MNSCSCIGGRPKVSGGDVGVDRVVIFEPADSCCCFLVTLEVDGESDWFVCECLIVQLWEGEDPWRN